MVLEKVVNTVFNARKMCATHLFCTDALKCIEAEHVKLGDPEVMMMDPSQPLLWQVDPAELEFFGHGRPT